MTHHCMSFWHDNNTNTITAHNPCTMPPCVPCTYRLQPSCYSRTTAQWEQEAMALLTAGDRLAALQLPGPSSGVVRCYIKRISNLLGVAQHFELRLEATDECLAVARRRVKSATSSYVIGLSGSAGGCSSSGTSTPSSAPSQHDCSSGSSLRRDDPEVIGKVRQGHPHDHHYGSWLILQHAGRLRTHVQADSCSCRAALSSRVILLHRRHDVLTALWRAWYLLLVAHCS